MNEATTNAVTLPLATDRDVLTDVLRQGAAQLLAQAIEAEVAAYLDAHSALRDEAGRQQVVRNGYLPQRAILTGVGPVEVKKPKARDRSAAADGERILQAAVDDVLPFLTALDANGWQPGYWMRRWRVAAMSIEG